MSEKITAESRTEFGKGAARRLRREGKVPAVLYGGGLTETVHLTLPTHDAVMALRHGGGVNSIIELVIDGKSQLARTQQIQADPVRRELEHLDFIAVNRAEADAAEAASAEAAEAVIVAREAAEAAGAEAAKDAAAAERAAAEVAPA